MTKDERIKALREALQDIADIANLSEGVAFYAMLASQALEKDQKMEEDNEQGILVKPNQTIR